MKTGAIIGIASVGALGLGIIGFLVWRSNAIKNAEVLSATYTGETKKSISRPTSSIENGDSLTLKNSKDGKYGVYERRNKISSLDFDPEKDFVLKSEINNIKKFVKGDIKPPVAKP